MHRIKVIVIPFFFLLLSFAGLSNTLLQDAAAAYEKGEFKNAIDLYLTILQDGETNFEIYYNLGTCYAKMDQLDFARLYLEKAILLKPGSKSANSNVKWIKTELSENFAPLPEFYPKTLWKRVAASIPYKIWYYLGFILLCLAAFCLWRLLFYREEVSKKKFLTSTFILTLFAALFVMLLGNSREKQLNIFNEYVILEKSLDVLTQPESSSELIQKIEPGAKVVLTNELGEWKQIIAEDGSKGWIRSEKLAKIEL